jgi:hypothetical protein
MTPPSTASLQDRIDRLQTELVVLRKRTNRGTTLTLLVGVLILAALSFYFYYGYTQIRSVMDADTLVTYAQQMLEDNLPDALRQVESEIKTSAPVWAKTLSQNTVTSIPSARMKLEEYVLEQADTTLKEVNVMSDDHFRKFVRENRAEIEQKFKELGDSPKLAEKSLLDLESRLDREMQKEMQTQAGDFLVSLAMANAQLKKLADGKKLTPVEEHERFVLRAARRLQMNHVEPGRAVQSSPTAAPVTRVKASLPAKQEEKKKGQ